MRATGAWALALGLLLMAGLGTGACRGKKSHGGRSAGERHAAPARAAPPPPRVSRVRPRARPEGPSPRAPLTKRPCDLPWDLRPGMTLPQVVKHFQARRIVVLHLRDHIVTFRPPSLHGIRLHTGRVFVDAPPGSTKPASLVRLELESGPRSSKEAGRTLFLQVAQRLQAAFKEVAWRTEAPRSRWRWVCGKDGAVRLRVDLERHDAVPTRAAGGTYQVRAIWRYAPNAPKPGPPKHTRFSPLPGATPAAVRRMVLRAGARWQDHARVYDLSFLPNGRVVVLGGSGAPESYAGTWAVTGGATPEVELRLQQDGFYARRHRYRAGMCRIDGQEPVPCLAGIHPPQLPYWYDR